MDGAVCSSSRPTLASLASCSGPGSGFSPFAKGNEQSVLCWQEEVDSVDLGVRNTEPPACAVKAASERGLGDGYPARHLAESSAAQA